jgi:serine/threonine protein kinase
LVLEYVKGYNLIEYIYIKGGKLSFNRTKSIAKQLLLAIRYLHSRGFSHRDLKSENILISEQKNGKPIVKLIDFAFTVKQVYKRAKHAANCGTPNYMAPEIIQKLESWPQPADIWALGAIIIKMSSGYLPFQCKFLVNFRR